MFPDQLQLYIVVFSTKVMKSHDYNFTQDNFWSYLAVTASQIQHHFGSTLSSKVLRTLGG